MGVFSRDGGPRRIGVAIGDQILDLAACLERGALVNLNAPVRHACAEPRLNELMGLGRDANRSLRREVSRLLDAASPPRPELLASMEGVEMHLAAAIGDYSDFYASIDHATNVGRMFRPDNPLMPNYKYVPIGYHGRASSVMVSGAPSRGLTDKFSMKRTARPDTPRQVARLRTRSGFLYRQWQPAGRDHPD